MKPVYSYTRRQAIEDGVLVDLSQWAGSGPDGMMGGFSVPVAVTSGVWSDINSIPPSKQGWQDVRGRAHDVLWMAFLAAKRNPGKDRVAFRVILYVGRRSNQTYWIHIGPGDNGRPVVTIMRPGED